MKTVLQLDDNGCWLACVAMLTGKDYDELKGKFTFQSKVSGRSAGPVVKLLDELGFDCEAKSTPVRKLPRLEQLGDDALVYFKNVDEDGDELGGHWMVWDHDEKVMRDPEGWKAGTTFKIKNVRRVRRKK